MPSIAVQNAKANVTAATAIGALTVDSTAYLFPGANAWVSKDDGSLSVRVKILAISGTTGLTVRKWPVFQDPASGTKYTKENSGAPSYGSSDMSAFNGVATHIYMEAQSVPVDPVYSKRVVP